MSFYDKIKNSIVKLQGLPEEQRKSIFFTLMVIIALIMGIFFIISARNAIPRTIESVKSIPWSGENSYPAGLLKEELLPPPPPPDISIDTMVSGQDLNIIEPSLNP